MAADLSSAVDSTLASQCMAFCQALASQGKSFSFTLKIDSNFSFSLDTRDSNVKATLAKKRTSPSTQRRNVRRREEFLKKKLNFSSHSSSALDAPADISPATTVAAAKGAFSPSVASTPATLPSSPSGASIPSPEHDDEDIPEVVFGEGDGTLVFCKKYSTPPAKVKHPVDGSASFQWSSKIDGSCFYEVKATAKLVRVFNPA